MIVMRYDIFGCMICEWYVNDMSMDVCDGDVL